MSQENIEYYRRRAREEREIAAVSTSPEAAKAHAELATHYEALVKYADLLPQASGLAGNDDDDDEPDRAA
jgi:hypothetical protein